MHTTYPKYNIHIYLLIYMTYTALRIYIYIYNIYLFITTEMIYFIYTECVIKNYPLAKSQ